MRLFSDEEQNDSLVSRSHIMKNNHKYLQKIDKVEDIIKEARQVNVERAQLVKNSALKKNILRR
jgi:DNA gyrase/topoisomerase IV subunit A